MLRISQDCGPCLGYLGALLLSDGGALSVSDCLVQGSTSSSHTTVISQLRDRTADPSLAILLFAGGALLPLHCLALLHDGLLTVLLLLLRGTLLLLPSH